MSVNNLRPEDLTDYVPGECLGDSYPLPWDMSRQERFCLIHLLRVLSPALSIEVGTHRGGSLQVLSRFSRDVISIDRNPEVASSLRGEYPNVEFRTGDSTALLPLL